LNQPDGVRQEVVVGADLLSGDGHDRAAHGAARRERVQAGALEREARTRGEVASSRGATYQVPVEVRPERRTALGMRWIIQYSRARKEKTMAERLAAELILGRRAKARR